MWDELDEPLGFASGGAAAWPVGRKGPMRGVATSAAILAIAIVFVMFPRKDIPVAGEPIAVAKVEVLPAPRKLEAPDVAAIVPQTASPPIVSPAQIEASGVKVIRGGGSGPPKPLIIDVTRALAARRASTEPDPQGSP